MYGIIGRASYNFGEVRILKMCFSVVGAIEGHGVDWVGWSVVNV